MLKKHVASEPALHINEIDVNDKYKFIRKIGQGSYGEVWLVLPNSSSLKHINTKQYVLKRLNLRQSSDNTTQNDIESAEREAKLLSTLKHPNIVAYRESFRSNDGFLNIVMAYCEGGDLYTKLKEKKNQKEILTENQLIEWFIQISMAIQYIHEKNILHRDLKTQNIFLTKNEIVKVGDLGIARTLKSGTDFATTMIGTPFYMSPEIFSNKPYGQKSDIWSLGCCVYEMITFEHVFTAKDMNALRMKIIREETPQISKEYSEPLTDIITSMLKKKPEDRPTAKTILQNSFIKQHILRLLDKTQMKCQNQNHTNYQPQVNTPPKSASSSPSRPTSGSNISPSKNIFPNKNTPVLPSYHPGLPPSHSRPSSSNDSNRSTPFIEPIQSTESKTHPRLHGRRSSPLPMNDQEKDYQFLSKVSQNDTIQRRKRDQKLNNHIKQHYQPSSSDEQDTSPTRTSNDNISQPIIIIESSEKHIRPNSVGSNKNSSRITKSCELNPRSHSSSARQRRRENKSHSSSEYSTSNESPNQTTTTTKDKNEFPRSISQDNLISEIEKKKEGEKDMNDLLYMLTATLKLSAKYSNESTDSDKTAIDNGYSNDRTIDNPLCETNRLHQRCQIIRDECLREISPGKLRRVLKLVENVSETQMEQEMIEELGEYLYHKYSGQIFSLKFYEDNLLKHS